MVGLVGLVRPMGTVGVVNLVGLVDLAGLVVPALFGGCYGSGGQSPRGTQTQPLPNIFSDIQPRSEFRT